MAVAEGGPWSRGDRLRAGVGAEPEDSAQESIAQTLPWDCHFRLSLVSVLAASLGPGSGGGRPAVFGEGSKVTPWEVWEPRKHLSY